MRTYQLLSRKGLWRFCLPLVLATTIPKAGGNGFDLPDQDAFAIGRGMAFVATADTPSAIYYNPAGISQLEGQQLRLGGYGLYMKPEYEPLFGGGSFSSDRNYHFLPHLFYTLSPEKSDFSFGIGSYSSWGLSSRWPQDTGFRTVATEGRLTSFTVSPVASWRVAENFSIAAGATITYGELEVQQGLIWPSQAFDLFKFEGHGWNAGYNLGALWKVHEKVSLGATFRSKTTIGLEGNTEYYNDVPFAFGPLSVPAFPVQHVPATTDFAFPLKAIVGVSYRPTPRWNLEFNADHTAWNQVTTTIIYQERGFGALIPQEVPLPLDWDSSWYYEFGATRYFENGWHVSLGYIFNENSVSDASYSPLVADMNRHVFSTGVGVKGQRWDFDVAYHFVYGPERTVIGSGFSPSFQTADGFYSFVAHGLAVSVGFHF